MLTMEEATTQFVLGNRITKTQKEALRFLTNLINVKKNQVQTKKNLVLGISKIYFSSH